MATARGTGKRHRRPCLGPAGLCAALGLLLALAGCRGTNESTAVAHDPLMGEQKPTGVAIGPTPPPQNRAGMGAPAPPATASKSVVGMLNPDPLKGGKQIAIDSGP